MFPVASSTQSCTEGLWICTFGNSAAPLTPKQGLAEPPLPAFIDCEGCCGVNSDPERDACLMMLCIMISSVLLLNTRGVLSETLFNTLALACRCVEHTKAYIIGHSTAHLLVVVRDFALELVSAQGLRITPNEYLGQTLLASPLAGHHSERGRTSLENRKLLLDTFPKRRCTTLVRPVVDEHNLRSLNSLPPGHLRPEFCRDVAALQSELSDDFYASSRPLDCAVFLARLRRLIDVLNGSDR